MPNAAVVKALSAVLAAAPFAFGLIRAIRTGTDVRYVWVALAAMAGGMIVTGAARGFRRPLHPAGLAAAVFVVSTALAVIAALVLGTTLGPGILIVAASFAACFAAASFLVLLARRAHR